MIKENPFKFIPATRTTSNVQTLKTVRTVEHIFEDGATITFRITFLGKCFLSCEFTSCGLYSLEMWKVLKEIAIIIETMQGELSHAAQ